MDGAVQPGRGRTLRSTVQDRNEEGRGSSYNQAYGAGSCGKNHGPPVPAAPSTGGHTPGRQGGATTVDGGRNRRGGGLSACQSQERTRSRRDTNQCVDHRTSGQSRDTRCGVQPSVEEWSIPYPMEGGSAGAIAQTWQTSREPSLVSATLHA